MLRILVLLLLISCLLLPIVGAGLVPTRFAIRAGKLIDGRGEKPLENPLWKETRLYPLRAGGSAPAGVEVVDLANATVLPGFIDVHTHLLLQGDVTAEEYDAQLLKQSIPYRAILAARNAQIALSHGFNAMRDLETEGAMYADVDVKMAIESGEVLGPRMRVATRAMTPTGMYPLLATFYCGVYNEQTSRLSYTNAGHLPPILVWGGNTMRLETSDMVVGMFLDSPYKEAVIELLPGDVFAAFADGVTEPEDAHEEQFGEERLIDLLIQNSGGHSRKSPGS